jgi:hypothetical protein
MVVDRDEQVFPPGLDGVVGAAGKSLAHALDAPELLSVEMNEIARPLMLVAHDGLGRLQVA